MKHSPREILGQRIDSGKLSPSELCEVRRVYDDLTAGRVGGNLRRNVVPWPNGEQNRWTERLYRKCGLALSQAKPRGQEDKKASPAPRGRRKG